jgi:hypothetical protein
MIAARCDNGYLYGEPCTAFVDMPEDCTVEEFLALLEADGWDLDGLAFWCPTCMELLLADHPAVMP